jgi:hypothetical protein
MFISETFVSFRVVRGPKNDLGWPSSQHSFARAQQTGCCTSE